MRYSWIHIDADCKELCPLEEMSVHWHHWLQGAEEVVRVGVLVLRRFSESVVSFTSFRGYDHSVLYTTAQLTEGRSARDQPKQPPAKKISFTSFHLFIDRSGT